MVIIGGPDDILLESIWLQTWNLSKKSHNPGLSKIFLGSSKIKLNRKLICVKNWSLEDIWSGSGKQTLASHPRHLESDELAGN